METWFTRVRMQIFEVLRNVSVEIAVFLCFASHEVFSVMFTTGLYWKICEQNFGNKGDETDCQRYSTPTSKFDSLRYRVLIVRRRSHVMLDFLFRRSILLRKSHKQPPVIETFMHRTTAQWKMYIALASAIPLAFIVPLYGAFGDKHGRKTNILLSLTGIILYAFVTLAQFTFVAMPLYISVVAHFLQAFSGGGGNVMSSCYAYIADSTKDPSMVTVRFSLLQVVHSVSIIIFGFLLGGIVHKMSFAHGILFSISLLTVAFFYILFRLRQVSPDKAMIKLEGKGSRPRTTSPQQVAMATVDTVSEALTEELGEHGFNATPSPDNGYPVQKESINADNDQSTSVPPPAFSSKSDVERCQHKCQSNTKNHWRDMKELVVGTAKTISKPRRGRQRAAIWVVTAAFFVLSIANSGSNMILNLFVLHSPLSWSTSQIAYYNGFKACVELVGTTVGIFSLKRLKFHETTILMISMISAIGRCVMTGLSHNTFMMYSAGVLGILADLMMPVCKSLIVQFVERNEVGKIYSLFHIANDFAGIISYSCMTTIYAVTVAVFPGFVFLLMAGLIALSLVAILWVHFDREKYQRKVKIKSEILNSSMPTVAVSRAVTLRAIKRFLSRKPFRGFSTFRGSGAGGSVHGKES